MLVTFLLQFMFACMGVQLFKVKIVEMIQVEFYGFFFKGTFYSCNDKSMLSEVQCRYEQSWISVWIKFCWNISRGFYLKTDTNKNRIIKLPRIWTNAKFHFDNVPQALLTLFTVATFEGWPRWILWRRFVIQSFKLSFI